LSKRLRIPRLALYRSSALLQLRLLFGEQVREAVRHLSDAEDLPSDLRDERVEPEVALRNEDYFWDL
jgi:hypothetical protein